jgi:hypothetical protein
MAEPPIKVIPPAPLAASSEAAMDAETALPRIREAGASWGYRTLDCLEPTVDQRCNASAISAARPETWPW